MKKLKLKRIAIAKLTDSEAHHLQGGAATPSFTSPKCMSIVYKCTPPPRPPEPGSGTVDGCGQDTGCSCCITCPC